MSIILEGIDMPKEGEWLEVIIKPTKEVIVDTIRYRDNALLKTEYDSAIQISKGHGRLIDASELIKSYMKGTKTGIDDFYDTIDIIDNAPTILESEE